MKVLNCLLSQIFVFANEKDVESEVLRQLLAAIRMLRRHLEFLPLLPRAWVGVDLLCLCIPTLCMSQQVL